MNKDLHDIINAEDLKNSPFKVPDTYFDSLESRLLANAGIRQEKPKKVFVVHGEDSVCTAFAECLKAEYKLPAYAPYSGTQFNLISGKLEYEAEPIVLKKKAKPASGAFARLLAAGQRLLAIIQRSDGLANKDMAKFTDQINAICDKMER